MTIVLMVPYATGDSLRVRSNICCQQCWNRCKTIWRTVLQKILFRGQKVLRKQLRYGVHLCVFCEGMAMDTVNNYCTRLRAKRAHLDGTMDQFRASFSPGSCPCPRRQDNEGDQHCIRAHPTTSVANRFCVLFVKRGMFASY